MKLLFLVFDDYSSSPVKRNGNIHTLYLAARCTAQPKVLQTLIMNGLPFTFQGIKS
jgi:hypothetical protein